jgi:curved DNA-binding protein
VDPFAVLGVAPGADEREVLGAYRDLAKQWHPDRGGGERAARRMAEINAACAPPPPSRPRRRRAHGRGPRRATAAGG